MRDIFLFLLLSITDNISLLSRDNIYIYIYYLKKRKDALIDVGHISRARMCKNNHLFLIALLFLLLNGSNIHCFSSPSWLENGDVIVLTNQNFTSKTKQYDVLLVMFYVKWCPYCQRLHPEYETAGTELLQNLDYPIYLAKFDCTNNKETQCSRRYAINGYPTLRIYRYGRFTGEELNYHNRTTNEIVKTMKALKKDGGQQEQTWYDSTYTNGMKDEMNKATDNVQRIWLFVGLFMVLCKPI
jgi:thiol-disulfide isomerase/thioredoxin